MKNVLQARVRCLNRVAILALATSPFLSAQDQPLQQPAVNSPPKLGYTISKETTYFTGPLKPDGTIDFVAAVNEHFGQGVTRENNAAVIILPLLDHPWTWGSDERRAAVLGAIGLKPEEYAGQRTMMELRAFSEAPGGGILKTIEAQYKVSLARRWTDEEFPQMRQWLELNRDPMSQIALAATRERYFVPFVSSDGSDSLINVLLEHAQCSREVARMFAIRANNHMANGRWKEAWDDILTIKNLGRLMAQSQSLVEGLVGIGITVIACDSAQRLIANAAPDDFDWEAVQSQWNTTPVLDIGRSLSVTERAMLIQMICKISSEQDPDAMLQQWLSIGQDETVDQAAARKASAKLLSGALQNMLSNGDVNFDDGLRYANAIFDRAVEAVSIADIARREAAYQEIEDWIQVARVGASDEPPVSAVVQELVSQPQKPDEQLANVLLGIVFPAIQGPIRAEMRIRASQNVVELALAARALQMRTGHLPRSLRELEPFVDKEAFVQPSTGEPIPFRADGEAIVIYHWGANCKDDGGKLDEAQTDWGMKIEK